MPILCQNGKVRTAAPLRDRLQTRRGYRSPRSTLGTSVADVSNRSRFLFTVKNRADLDRLFSLNQHEACRARILGLRAQGLNREGGPAGRALARAHPQQGA